MNVIERNNCISCNGSLENVYTINDFPIFMGATTQPVEEDLQADMIFAKCTSCNCIQLKNLIPLDILYAEPHNTATGVLWQKHHKQFSNFVKKHAKGKVVEVGGANLILAEHLKDGAEIDSITVYDTNITADTNSNKIFLKEQFFDHTTVDTPPDAIIHSHVIEHLYDPITQIKLMCDILHENGVMLISAPVIDVMMEDGFTNAMNFEHTYALTKNLLQKILKNSGMKIIDKQDFSRHCVFVAAVKDYNVGEFNHEHESCNYFNKFISHYESEIQKIDNMLQKPEETFIFGAHIFTQFLLKLGLEENKFSCILDNDAKKQSNRLYGTNLIVKSPKILREISSPLVVLKAGQYTDEIKKDILENINPKTRFIL